MTQADNFKCDVCSNLCPQGSMMSGCRQCDYDVCGKCYHEVASPSELIQWCGYGNPVPQWITKEEAARRDQQLQNMFDDCRRKGIALPTPGRPYTTENGSLVAPASWSNVECTGTPWSEASRDKVFDEHPKEWTAAIADEVSKQWLLHGQEEHASVASFARFSLDLLRFAAPPHLLAAAHRAACDEVAHAVATFGLAAKFRGNSGGQVWVESFPALTVDLSKTLDTFLARTFAEGCVGESVGVACISYSLRAISKESPARKVLEQLLKDEAQHAALAWATTMWAIDNGGTIPHDQYEKSAIMETARAHQSCDPSLSLTWCGLLPKQQAEELATQAGHVWITPWLSALSQGRRGGTLPSVLDKKSCLVSTAISEALELVREQLVLLESATV